MTDATAPRPTMTELVETYGMLFVVVTLAIFAVEMTVLTSLLAWGVDLEPFAAWVHQTTGWDIGGVLGSTGYLAIAYGITRVFKPVSFALSLVITPLVAPWWGHRTAPEPNHEQEDPR